MVKAGVCKTPIVGSIPTVASVMGGCPGTDGRLLLPHELGTAGFGVVRFVLAGMGLAVMELIAEASYDRGLWPIGALLRIGQLIVFLGALATLGIALWFMSILFRK